MSNKGHQLAAEHWDVHHRGKKHDAKAAASKLRALDKEIHFQPSDDEVDDLSSAAGASRAFSRRGAHIEITERRAQHEREWQQEAERQVDMERQRKEGDEIEEQIKKIGLQINKRLKEYEKRWINN